MAKRAKKDPHYYGFILFNDRNRFEHITGYFWTQEAASNAAIEYLKTHPTWSAKVVKHQVLKTIAFNLTPVVGK